MKKEVIEKQAQLSILEKHVERFILYCLRIIAIIAGALLAYIINS